MEITCHAEVQVAPVRQNGSKLTKITKDNAYLSYYKVFYTRNLYGQINFFHVSIRLTKRGFPLSRSVSPRRRGIKNSGETGSGPIAIPKCRGGYEINLVI